MKLRPLANVSAFAHTEVTTNGRLLIQSTCRQCGKSRMLSCQDGSLELWEDFHKCDPRAGEAGLVCQVRPL
jgi:hypothetical protein